jgi:2-polyprenyl-3-methyl-5-hydroxy-6-metoxy-1,4-benzoquinol methylase
MSDDTGRAGGEDRTVEQRIQDDQYEFPYHYIPTHGDGQFSQTRHWSWGFRYLGGMRVVLDQLADISFDSLIDIGCGDGRFLSEVAGRHPDTDLLGVDYSQRAIDMASAMNPDLEYRCEDITERAASEQYDVATLVEVLEHIPPTELEGFVDAVAERVRLGGTIVVTAPHENKPVTDKYFQHFGRDDFRAALDGPFTDLQFIPFDDVYSLGLRLLTTLLGDRGNNFLITNSRARSWFYELYLKRYLYTDWECCGRVAAVGRRVTDG